MKKMHQVQKSSVIFFMVLYVGLASHQIIGEQDHQSFDSLFPKTWYTKAVESCAAVWGAFDDLIVRQAVPSIDRAIMIDAAIGRLVFAQFCLDLLANAQEQSVSLDDVSYLARVVAVVNERCGKVADLLERDRAYCMQRVIHDLQKKISLLQSKDASFGTDH